MGFPKQSEKIAVAVARRNCVSETVFIGKGHEWGLKIWKLCQSAFLVGPRFIFSSTKIFGQISFIYYGCLFGRNFNN